MEKLSSIALRKFIGGILFVVCFAAMVMSVTAEGDDIPRVTFENRKSEAPDLYIKKQVKTSAEGYEAPEGQEFSFVLKLDGELAKRLEYRVFDKKGEEIFDRDILGNRKPFQTNRSGGFKLKTGQTAKFEYVGSGVTYEVAEQAVQGYLQIQPQGGAAATGTVSPDGTLVNFVNLYIPKSHQDKTNLMVRKSISFPEGYEIPETPYFTFRIRLDGKVYSHEKYEIRDIKTDELLSEGTTDLTGTFRMQGGCTAVFREIPVDVDYSVEESETEEWYAIGDVFVEGTTISPGTIVDFTNKNASFAVSKEVEGQIESDEEFVFLLTRADRTVWADAEYYLYRTAAGILEDDVIHKTGSDGTFRLKKGQTAVFCGAEPGTVFSIHELANPDYVQILPESPAGYADKMVSDAVEMLPFVNKMLSKKGILSVTKIVENVKDAAPFAQDTFSFFLYRKNSDQGQGNVYEPVKEAVYTVSAGNSERTGQTDPDGKFSLRANETARFNGLSYGEYKIEETQPSAEYVAKDSMTFQEGSLTEDGVQFPFVNLYLCKELDLYLIKKGKDDQPLKGAAFMLYRDIGLTNAVREEPFVSSEDGTVSMMDLKAGTYYLKEVQSPPGYQLPVNPIKIDIIRKENNMEVMVDDKPAGTDEAGQIYTKIYADQDDEVYITVYNNRNFLIPMTGGRGIWTFVTVGMVGVLISIWSYKKWCFRKRTGMLRNNQKQKGGTRG